MNSDDLKGRINLLAAILRMGHEAFTRSSLKDLSFYIVNTSRQIVPYTRSCLIDFRYKRPRVFTVMGHALLDPESEYCLQVEKLLSEFQELSQATVINEELLTSKNARQTARDAFAYFQKNPDNRVVLLPLRHPYDKTERRLFIWMIEIPSTEEKVLPSLILLSNHYAEAVWFHTRKNSLFSSISFALFRPLFILVTAVAILLFCLVYWKLALRSNAEFELISHKSAISYAPLNGVIQQVFQINGAQVNKGDLILRYDTEELLFELLSAENRYNEVTARLEDAKLQAFLDIHKRAEVKILELKQKQEKIRIEEIRRQLRLCEIKTEQSGILIIEERQKMEGKRFQAGDKLFEVMNPKELLAEIYLEETESAVLEDEIKITLFLHARPEHSIAAQVISISPKPVVTLRQQWCYRIKASFEPLGQGYLCGMRGLARIEGKHIPLWYYLFRNAILWWRRL